MKKGIHPNYRKTTIKCVCGNVFETRSTVGGDITVEICSSCHPFFTGKQKLVDTAGRVERFMRKYGMDDSAALEEARAREKSGAPEPEAPAEEKQAPAAEAGTPDGSSEPGAEVKDEAEQSARQAEQ